MIKRKLESQVLREICDYLASTEVFFWRSNNIPVYGKSNDGQRRYRSLPKYTPRGLPDISIVYKGMAVFLEVKRDGKTKQSEDQEFIMRRIRTNGGLYYVVWSIKQVEEIMDEISK